MGLIEIRDLYKIYNEGLESAVRALDGVSLSIEYGEFVAIVGSSGSGKSTMMNILGCLDIPTRGEYTLDDIPIAHRSERELSEIRSRKISFIFQGYNLIPSLSVWQNVALPMTYQGVPPAERQHRAMDALDAVGITAKARKPPTPPLTASPIIMADEPTGALDSKTGQQVLDILRGLHSLGTTVILITHDNGIAAKAERVVRLQDGHIVEDRPNVPDESRALNANL